MSVGSNRSRALGLFCVIAFICACDPGHRAKSAPAPEQPSAANEPPPPKPESSSDETADSPQEKRPTPVPQPASRSAVERTKNSKSSAAPAMVCERDDECVVKNVGNC